MEGDRKRFSKGWFTGLVLGTMAAGGAAVYAVTLPHTFQDGQTASAAQVNANFAALRDALNGVGPCAAANESDEMVRVGSVCIDKNPASLFDGPGAGANALASIPATCATDGTGCDGIYAQSRATPGALKDGTQVSWARAARACANSGKRLPTAGEWATAKSMGIISLPADAGEWVDGAGGGTGDSSPLPASHIRVSAAGKLNYFSNPAYPYDMVEPTTTDVGFRCAR